MAKKDSFIKRAAHWVARMFGYKAENKFARVVWYVFATCAALVALYVAVALTALIVDEAGNIRYSIRYHRKDHDPSYLHDFGNQYVSPYVIYHSSCPSYLYNTVKGVRTLENVRWICKSSDGDSLVCFSSVDENKRGYFNRFTGEVVIPEQYEKAWVFSEGVACVLDKGELHFIDHKGNLAIDKSFPYSHCLDYYCFHNGLCMIAIDDEKIGLIGRDGEWKLEPEYSFIRYESKGFWIIQDSIGYQGLLRADGSPFLPCEYTRVVVRNTDYISVRLPNHVDQLYDFDGNLVNACEYADVEKLTYSTDEFDEYGSLKAATAHCLRYESHSFHYGLMDRNGNMITLPIYDRITAIGPHRYLCDGDEGTVILDDHGKVCGEKL